MRFRVTCDRTPLSGLPHCRFNGYRKALDAEAAGAKACPKCGGPVQVTPLPVRAARPA